MLVIAIGIGIASIIFATVSVCFAILAIRLCSKLESNLSPLPPS